MSRLWLPWAAAAAFCGVIWGGTPALAREAGGHRLDIGVAPYVQAGDRGGGKAEIRYNLAPGESSAALYATFGGGLGSWFQSRRPTGLSKLVDAIFVVPWLFKTLTGEYEERKENFTEVRTRQNYYLDLGLGVAVGTFNIQGGVTFVDWRADVLKAINGDPYVGSGTGFHWGGFGQMGWSIPIDRWFVDFGFGYRRTRGRPAVRTVNAFGATNDALIRPVTGLYGTFALRYRI
jgi:hypothetical protein